MRDWENVDWSFLTVAKRRHIRALLSRLRWLATKETHLPDGRKTFFLSEAQALDWVLGLILDTREGA